MKRSKEERGVLKHSKKMSFFGLRKTVVPSSRARSFYKRGTLSKANVLGKESV